MLVGHYALNVAISHRRAFAESFRFPVEFEKVDFSNRATAVFQALHLGPGIWKKTVPSNGG